MSSVVSRSAVAICFQQLSGGSPSTGTAEAPGVWWRQMHRCRVLRASSWAVWLLASVDPQASIWCQQRQYNTVHVGRRLRRNADERVDTLMAFDGLDRGKTSSACRQWAKAQQYALNGPGIGDISPFWLTAYLTH